MLMRCPRSVIVLSALALAVHAHAQGGPDVRAFFKSLTQPTSGGSCCDLSDCRQVESEWKDGTWYARAVVKGWLAIPKDKIIHNKPNIMEKAILCTSPGDTSIYCFLPQDFGT